MGLLLYWILATESYNNIVAGNIQGNIFKSDFILYFNGCSLLKCIIIYYAAHNVVWL